MMGTTKDFDAWAPACVEHTAGLVRDGLPNALQPRLEGSARIRWERYVSFEHRQRGRFALWLYVVPPEHSFGTGMRATQHGAGIVDWSREVVPEDVGREWFGPDSPFRWQRIGAGFGLYLLIESSNRPEPPESAAGRFAAQVLDGLRQASFF